MFISFYILLLLKMRYNVFFYLLSKIEEEKSILSLVYLFFFNPIEVCRWLIRINQLLSRYMLEKPHIEFIHIFAQRCKMYNKILCLVLNKFKSRRVNQQVTLLSNNNGTSETACDITFQFNNYLNQKALHKKKLNKKFLEWFIGFTEGNGSFVVLNNKVYFDISLNIDNIQVLYYIKKELGFGKVLIKKEDSIPVKGIFYVTSKDNFYRLITLFNGNLCTINKKEQFKTWLKILNYQYSNNILFIDRLVKPSISTGWLSGFIDAVACFTGLTMQSIGGGASCKSRPHILGSVPPPPAGNRLQINKAPYLTFYILQKEFYILNIISEKLVNVKFKNIKYNKDLDGWIFSCSSFTKLKLIINYLNRYNLKTKKSLAFTKWCKIYNIVIKKEHINSVGLNKIHLLTKEINNNF